jgi:hypothetical protein
VNNGATPAPEATVDNGQENLISIENLALTPEGVADAPASEELESIVHTGNS